MPELDDAALERRLRGVLKEHLGALPLDLTVEALDRRREAKGVARGFGRGRGMTLLAAAALLLVGGALAAGSGILRLPTVVPPVPVPSVIAVATTSPDATSPSPSDSASRTPVPSATRAPITWTGASLKEDWPWPVRTERPGRPIVIPTFLKMVIEGCPDCGVTTDWGDPLVDPTGDTGSPDNPWADIEAVTFCGPTCLSIERVSYPPPAADPRQLWIAYGVVVDTDGDGVPDWRYGVDNVPLDKPDSESERWWRTDLHTGRTDSAVGEFVVLSEHEAFWHGTGSLQFGVENLGIGEPGGMPKRFYVWASVIQDGRVVATDYAPDAGWLAPSADAKP